MHIYITKDNEQNITSGWDQPFLAILYRFRPVHYFDHQCKIIPL